MRLAAPLLAALLLAGCASSPETSREAGSIEPGDARFSLTVQVVSLETGERLAGARVSSPGAEGARASGATDDGGSVTLEFAAPQVIALEAQADGHAPVGTFGIALGDVPRDGTEIGDALTCLFTFGMVCPVDQTTSLPGTAGSVTLRLVPTSFARELEIALPPDVADPAAEKRIAVEVPYAADPEASAIYERAAARAEATLRWTQEPGKAADVALALECGASGQEIVRAPAAGPASLAALGERSLTVAGEVPPECGPLHVAVILGSASTEVVAHASVLVTTKASVQRPRA